MPVSMYEVIWIFLVYAFLGWCMEVAFAAFHSRAFVNRGFLNGPVCPIYGCGVLLVIVALSPLQRNFFLLFLGSFVLTSAIEFLTGFLLEKLFHNRWWDYSERKFNLCGYICPLFSFLWGVGCILVLKMLHPVIYKGIRLLPKLPGIMVLSVLCVIFVVDLAITVASILKFNERLRLLDEIAGKIKVVSDEIGENIYGGVSVAVEKGGEFKGNIYEGVSAAVEKGGEFKGNFDIKAAELKGNVDIKAAELKGSVDARAAEWRRNADARAAEWRNLRQEKKMERARLQQEYNRLLKENVSFGMKRLMRAFPRMKSNAYQEALLKWKGYWMEKRRK